jgi:hypothetical protein
MKVYILTSLTSVSYGDEPPHYTPGGKSLAYHRYESACPKYNVYVLEGIRIPVPPEKKS